MGFIGCVICFVVHPSPQPRPKEYNPALSIEIKKHVVDDFQMVYHLHVSLYVQVIFPVSSPEEVTCIFYLIDFQSC